MIKKKKKSSKIWQAEVFIQAEARSVILEHLQEEELPSKA